MEYDLYTYKGTVTKVVDGDTVDIDVDLGFHMVARLRFRLSRIDTPEIRGEERPEGLKSKEFVETMINGREVLLKSQKTGKFGRWLAEIYYSEGSPEENEWVCLNDKLLEEGLADPY